MFQLSKEQLNLQNSARELAEARIQKRAAEIDRTEDYPWDNVEDLKNAGFMGMTIPEEFGGKGADFLDAVLVIEEMGKVCGVSSRIVVEANMGAISAVMKYGSPKQKKKWQQTMSYQATNRRSALPSLMRAVPPTR